KPHIGDRDMAAGLTSGMFPGTADDAAAWLPTAGALPAVVPAVRPTPSAVHWKRAVSGNWTSAADWSTGAVPGAGNTVTIGVSGDYTVTINTAATAQS